MTTKEDLSRTRVTIVLAVLSGLLLGLLLHPAERNQRMELNKIDRALSLIERNYVDPLGRDSITDRALSLLLSSLDPHSHYATAAEMNRREDQVAGSFEGIGILLHPLGDTICVHQALPDGPSEKAGLRVGDRLVKAGNTLLVGLPQDEVVRNLRGPRGTRVVLTIRRPGEEGQRQVAVVRGNVATPSLPYAGMLDATHGYLLLTRFSETSGQEFRTAVTSLKAQGMRHLLLDLRGNGGGVLPAALSIADDLLPGREVILYTEGAHDRRRTERSTPGGVWSEGGLTVIVDEYSASASEIIAGAVQDNDRGIVVGRRTFGKGLVQRELPLNDGSALLLTIARYHTPSGRCIQRPYDKGNDAYYLDFLQQLALNHGGDTTLLRPTDTTRYFTTSGRVVYAGGGILPDHPLTLFTDTMLVYYNSLNNKGLFRQWAFDYATRNYDSLRRQFPSEEAFIASFRVSDDMLQQVVDLGQESGVPRHPACLARYGRDMRTHLKALLGECLFSTSCYYHIMTQIDNELKQAIKLSK